MVALPIAVLSLAAVSVSVGIRLAPNDPGQWHQDPLTVQAPESPNWFRLTPPGADRSAVVDREGTSPVFDVPVAELETAFDEVATGDGRVTVLAGSAAEGFVTYVQRSALMGYPDYVSVRFVEVDADRSTLAIMSRARYGSGDLGVNEKRVRRWMHETQDLLN
ncbi:MAG: DUF1499 domain-containing protein [Ornithinimicrobium sp.]